jgi:hypothetical protein
MSDLSPDCAPKRRSASATGTLRKLTEMTDPDPSPFANCHVIVCYGGAGLFDGTWPRRFIALTTRLSAGCSGASNAGAPAL